MNISDAYDKVSSLYCGFLTPALLFAVLKPRMDGRLIEFLVRMFLIIYVADILVAYYERFTQQNLFYDPDAAEWTFDYNQEKIDFVFRATSLLGHPLNNGYFAGLAMVYILMTDRLRPLYKYALWVMGLLGILCFNARGAFLLSVAFLVVYSVYNYSTTRSLVSAIITVASLVATAYIINYVMGTTLGGRLASGEVMDGSAQTRIDIWNPLFHANFVQLCLGFAPEDRGMMTHWVGSNTAENWLAIFFYKIGVPATLFFLYCYYKIYNVYLSRVSVVKKMFLWGAFVGFASINNTLAIGSSPWLMAFLLFAIYGYDHSTKVSEIQK